MVSTQLSSTSEFLTKLTFISSTVSTYYIAVDKKKTNKLNVPSDFKVNLCEIEK